MSAFLFTPIHSPTRAFLTQLPSGRCHVNFCVRLILEVIPAPVPLLSTRLSDERVPHGEQSCMDLPLSCFGELGVRRLILSLKMLPNRTVVVRRNRLSVTIRRGRTERYSYKSHPLDNLKTWHQDRRPYPWAKSWQKMPLTDKHKLQHVSLELASFFLLA